jgi:Arc/MetJ-type ribon-helix-helix transcriptional regulator
MKLSVSLPPEDVEFVDRYARERGVASRSGVVHQALRLLRASGLESDYRDAWEEWSASGEDDAWETVAEDGLAG